MTARKTGLSYLRILSCFGIVLLHTLSVAELLARDVLSPQADLTAWAVLNCLRWAVPCFVMITGALLLDPARELPIKKIYGKYLVRVLAALVVFSFIYRIFSCAMDRTPLTAENFGRTLSNLWTGGGWAHLWYLYTLIGLYLLLPFYRMIAKAASDRELRLLLGIWLLFVSILPLTKIFGLETGFEIPTSTIYPLYLFAGHAVDRRALRIPRPAAVILIAVCAALLCAASFHNADGTYADLLSYSSVYVVVMAVSLFSLFAGRAVPAEEAAYRSMPRLLLTLDRCCFGIYLVHMMFLRLFLKYWLWAPLSGPAVRAAAVTLGIAALAFVLSAAVTAVLRLVPVVKKIV